MEHVFLDDWEIDAFGSVEQLIHVALEKPYDLIILDTELIEQGMYEKVVEEGNAMEQSEDKRVLYKIKTKRCLYLKINLKNVFWFSSMGPLITVNMADDTFVYRGCLNTIEREVSDLIGCFVRVNKRYLVNVKYIKSFSERAVTMIDNEEIPLSKKYSREFFEKTGKDAKGCSIRS